MWIFTPTGFLSVVAHRDKPGVLLVRARARADLEAIAPSNEMVQRGPPGADYAYRMEMLLQDFIDVTAALTMRITYDNFKNEVSRKQGHERAKIYSDIWYLMRRAQNHGQLEK